jgi:hypothetical protein
VTRPGDFFLWHGSQAVDRLIQWGTRSIWTHCGLFIGDDQGRDIIQATSERGVALATFAPVPGRSLIVDSGLDGRGRELAVAEAYALVGRRYGWPSIASYALDVILPSGFYFASEGRLTCGQVVARAIIAGGKRLDRDDDRVRPRDLAAAYGIPIDRWP